MIPVNWPIPLLVLDPSSTKIGWALLGPGPSYIDSGVAHLPSAPPDERVRMVGSAINAICDRLGRQGRSRPALALIELPDYIASYANTANIVLYFRAVGVAEYATHLHGLPIEYVKASKLKEITRKQQAIDRFKSIVGRYPNTDDESDAFCIGWDYLAAWHAQQPPAAPHANNWHAGWDEVGDADPDPF